MEAGRRPWPAVKVLCWGSVVLLGLGLIPVLIWLWIDGVADRRWAAMEARAAEIAKEVRERAPRRPVLRGEAVPGNAWDDYLKALNGLQGRGLAGKQWPISFGDGIESTLKRGDQNGKCATFLKLLEDHGMLLVHLREGARRAEGQFPYDWEEGYEGPLPSLIGCLRLVQLARVRAWRDRQEGNSLQAAEILLDACQFARDIGSNGPVSSAFVSCAVWELALKGLQDLIKSGELDREALTQMARELKELDGSFRHVGLSLLNEPAFFWADMRGHRDYDLCMSSKWNQNPSSANRGAVKRFWKGRQWGFSRKFMAADAMGRFDRMVQRLAEAWRKPWADAVAWEPLIIKECVIEDHPLLESVISDFQGAVGLGRKEGTRLRLLRIAANYLTDGQVLDLDDFYGVKILRVKFDGRLRIWSVGPDGKDDGGKGDWEGRAGPDIVLEVRR